MRSTSFFAALFVVVAVGRARRRPRTAREAGAAAAVGTATLVGDSLNVGVERYLADALPHWRIVANDRVGRTTPEGIAELEAGRPALSSYVVVSLGTNDGQRRRRVPGERRARAEARRPRPVRDLGDDLARRRAERRLQRRPAGGRGGEHAPAARRLGRDGRDRTPSWLAADGLHGNETGYRERARAVAEAARSCAPGP